jgi:hypothetical protein
MDVHAVDLHHQGGRGRLAPVGWWRLAGLGLRHQRLLLRLRHRPNPFGHPADRLGRHVDPQGLREQVGGRAEARLDPDPTHDPG